MRRKLQFSGNETIVFILGKINALSFLIYLLTYTIRKVNDCSIDGIWSILPDILRAKRGNYLPKYPVCNK